MSVIFEGELKKKGKVNKAWKRRWFCLREINGDTILQYYENKCNKKPNGFINISDVYDMQVISHHDLLTDNLPKNININMTTKSDKKYSFQMYTKIKTKKRTYSFAALDITTFTKWINILHKYIYTATIKHGWLYKRGHRNTEWKNRYFTLNDNNQIKYYSDFEQTDICGTIDLKQITTIKNRNDVKYPYMFELITQHRTWVLRAENETDRESWICEIKKQKHAQPTLTRMTAIETYSKLINMDFDEKTSLEAASKHPDDINKALSWTITNQLVNKTVDSDEEVRQMFKNQTHKKRNKHHIRSASDRSYLDRFRSIPNKYDFIQNVSVINNDECKSIESCNAVQRIISVLKIYKSDTDMKKQKRLDLGTTMSRILNDYHHILETHLNEDIMETHKCNQEFASIHRKIIENELCCDISKCFIYLRNHRNREKGVVQTDEDLCLYDILDCIHCYFIHSVDVGYRILHKINVNEHSVDDCNMSHNAEIAAMKAYLCNKRKNLQKIRGTNRFQNNKFMTQIVLRSSNVEPVVDEKMEQNKPESIDMSQDDVQYSFGVSYEFWQKPSHRAKFKTFKQELIQNTIYCIDKTAFDHAHTKAVRFYNHSPKIRKLKSHNFSMFDQGRKYGVEGNKKINVSQILSLIFYTDFDTLSFNFSKTFRYKNQTETYQQILIRNSEYYHWSKILIETVNCYGQTVTESKVPIFYHGVSKVYFDSFIAKFSSPTSTTTKAQIATIFAKDNGIILELKKRNHILDRSLRYFNCSFISCFGNEDERLFISPPGQYYLQFNSIRNMSTNENYKYFIHALTKFEQLIKGDFHPITSQTAYMQILLNLAKYAISNKNIEKYPSYILKSFIKWTNKKENIIIDLKDIKTYDALSYEFLLVDKNIRNLISFDKINCLFKNVRQIECRSVGTIVPKCVKLLDTMLNKVGDLVYSKLKIIYLNGVENVHRFYTAFVNYQSAKTCKNWTIQKMQSSIVIKRV